MFCRMPQGICTIVGRRGCGLRSLPSGDEDIPFRELFRRVLVIIPSSRLAFFPEMRGMSTMTAPTLTHRQLTLLIAICTHYVVTAAQARRVLFPAGGDRDGRATRRVLVGLLRAMLIHRTRCEVVNPLHGLTCPVYYPSAAGAQTLAVLTGDTRWLLTPTATPNWMNLRHWSILTDLRLIATDAIRRQAFVGMSAFYNEFDIVCESDDPAVRYRLYTVCSQSHEKKIVCVPDAAFALTANGGCRAFYLEIETGSNAPAKCSHEKRPGFTALEHRELYRRHFPEASDFRVLCLAPEPLWRDVLRREFAKRKDGLHLWKFGALSEINAATFLHAPIFYGADDGPPMALVKGGQP